MAAINCCNFDESCKDIVTIGYMKQMADMGGCAQVSGDSAFTSCCDADALAYTPTYGEISGGTYAPIRTYNDVNPSNDVDGFSAITSGDYDGCCGNIDASGKCVTRDELFYGTTELDSITLLLTQSPSQCDTNFTVKETDTYIRRIYGCNNDVVEEIPSLSSTTSSFSSSGGVLTKSYGEITTNIDSSTSIISGVATSQVSFNTVTVTVRKKKRACDEAESVSKSIPVTSQPYTDSVTILCPKTIECDGGKISATTYSPCTNEISISGALTDSSEEISSSTSSNTTVYSIGRNETGYASNTFRLSIKISGQTKDFDITFGRESCTIGPSRANPTPCGAFPVEDDWCKSPYKDDIVIHNASGGTVSC